jgi:TetR/AcrR family transcriptional regulator, tetracycline repressor protein
VTDRQQPAGKGAGTPPLWFSPPAIAQGRPRRALSRDRVVAEALTIISADGVDALTMRALAARLDVVPGALYRHVRSKEQLYDLLLDAVLAEVDCHVDDSLTWIAQVRKLAQRLRAVLEGHPGIAGLLKTRDPVSPHSLELAEAFLAALHGAGLPGHQTAIAFRLVYDHTVSFALSDWRSAAERRVRDPVTRSELHAFLRSLPASRFPVLARLGDQVWADDRDERFATGLAALLAGLQALQRPHT